MNFHKKGPYLLLFILLSFLFFVIGMNYGKRVEHANKTIQYLMNITPTSIPVSQPKLEYLTYENTTCDIAFTYPSHLKINKESSNSAILYSDNPNHYLEFSCDPTVIQEQPKKEATTSVSLKDNTITAYTYDITHRERSLTIFDLVVSHPQTSRRTRFKIDKDLFSLFKNSYNFL